MFALVSSAVSRTTSVASELGHLRWPSIETSLPPGAGGPAPGACHCWHVEDDHEAVCLVAGCTCGDRFHRPVFGYLTLALAVLRGGR